MKLLKKLLPIASVATIATIVTPLTISCGSGNGISDFNYMPDIAMHEAKDFSQPDALKEYFDCVKENPKIFVEDLYWAQSQFQTVISDGLKIYADKGNVKFYMNVENVSVSSTTKEGVTTYLMSFDLDYSWSLSGQYDDYSEGYKVTRTADASCERHMKFTNIPFSIDYFRFDTDLPYYWTLRPSASSLTDLVALSPDLEIKANVAVHSKVVETSQFGTIVEDPYIDYKFNSTFNKDYLEYPDSDILLLASVLTNISYHFLDCGLQA